MLAGGVLVLLSTFLDWISFFGFGFNAYSGDAFGFTGILLAILSLKVIGGTAIRSFAPQISLPKDLLGFSMNELSLFAGYAAFVWGFSMIFATASAIGPFICAVGGAAIVVGAILEQREEAAEPTRAI